MGVFSSYFDECGFCGDGICRNQCFRYMYNEFCRMPVKPQLHQFQQLQQQLHYRQLQFLQLSTTSTTLNPTTISTMSTTTTTMPTTTSPSTTSTTFIPTTSTDLTTVSHNTELSTIYSSTIGTTSSPTTTGSHYHQDEWQFVMKILIFFHIIVIKYQDIVTLVFPNILKINVPLIV
ncbi:hypothetical protein ACTFIR_006812 [Dictyostelium discoideum]